VEETATTARIDVAERSALACEDEQGSRLFQRGGSLPQRRHPAFDRPRDLVGALRGSDALAERAYRRGHRGQPAVPVFVERNGGARELRHQIGLAAV
jgi:hypothetical protein